MGDYVVVGAYCPCLRLMKEQGQSHAKTFQEFEDAFTSKLDAVTFEVRKHRRLLYREYNIMVLQSSSLSGNLPESESMHEQRCED